MTCGALDYREEYSEPYQTSKMERLRKKIIERSILKVWQSSEYASAKYFKF